MELALRQGCGMSELSSRIMEDLKAAMKSKDTLTLTVLRNLKSALKYAAIEAGGADAEIDDAAAQAVIRREIKKRDDAATSFRDGKRPELAEKEEAEAAILKNYLPEEMPVEKVEELIAQTIADLGASSRKDMGAVMKALQEKTAGAVDNKTLSQLVMQKLS